MYTTINTWNVKEGLLSVVIDIRFIKLSVCSSSSLFVCFFAMAENEEQKQAFVLCKRTLYSSLSCTPPLSLCLPPSPLQHTHKRASIMKVVI